MSESPELQRILSDLATGVIDTQQASESIAALERPEPAVVASAEDLYDDPPEPAQRAADSENGETVDDPAAEEAVEADPDEAAGQVADAELIEEDSVEPEHTESATDESGQPHGRDTTTVFSLQMDDVAATAGEFVRDAGDFAKSAFERLGKLAGSVIPETGDPHPVETATGAPGPTGRRGIERIVLRSVGRRVRLVGDPRVATIAADGPHTLRRQGVTLEVNTEGELGLKLDGFSVVRPPRSVEDLRVLGFGQELVVRINPAIPVDAEVTGSRLTTVGVPYLGRIRVSAGGANLSGVVQVSDALVQAGGATIAGPLSGGRSVVRVESGNLTVRLTPDANVSVHAQSQLGRVSWPGDQQANLDEFVVGSGAARLEIGVVMGRAVVRVSE